MPVADPLTTLYWLCLGGGLVVTVLLVLAGDVLEGLLDAVDGPVDLYTVVGGLSAFGGAGLLLTEYSSLATVAAAVVAGVLGVVAAVLLEVLYVRPMRRGETSIGFSQQEYAGKTGELSTSVAPGGFGEVVIRMGASTTFQTAASFTGEALPDGARVVVVEVAPDGVLRVAPLTDADTEGAPAGVPAALPSRYSSRA